MTKTSESNNNDKMPVKEKPGNSYEDVLALSFFLDVEGTSNNETTNEPNECEEPLPIQLDKKKSPVKSNEQRLTPADNGKEWGNKANRLKVNTKTDQETSQAKQRLETQKPQEKNESKKIKLTKTVKVDDGMERTVATTSKKMKNLKKQKVLNKKIGQKKKNSQIVEEPEPENETEEEKARKIENKIQEAEKYRKSSVLGLKPRLKEKMIKKYKEKEIELVKDLFGNLPVQETGAAVSKPDLSSASKRKREEDQTLNVKEKNIVPDDSCAMPDLASPSKRKREEDQTLDVKKNNIPDDCCDIYGIDNSCPSKMPAWIDEDDDNIRVKDVVGTYTKARGTRGIREISEKKYESELREKFTNVVGDTPDWADLTKIPVNDPEDESDLLKKTGNYLTGRASLASLPKKYLEFKQMTDLNSSHSEGALIKAIDFNPHLQIGLVSGSNHQLGVVSLYQVDGNNNHKIHSVRMPGLPITSAQFMCDGKRFVMGSEQQAYFFVYDMEASKETRITVDNKREKSIKRNIHVSPDGQLLIFIGNHGKMSIYNTASLSLIDTLHCPSQISSAAFNSDGSKMYTHGLSGEVFIWDMNARQCIYKFWDDGCIQGSSIAMSPNNQYLACGSKSGVVNIYDTSSLTTTSPTPVKILSNLTTTISDLTFCSTSEILAMTSRLKDNAVKLVHFPSMTIFENFPIPGRFLKKAESMRFSPNGGYFAVGNVAGKVPLFRLKHFASY